MKRLVSFCAIPVLAITMIGCNASGNHDADVASLKANEAQWVQDWASHNVDKVAAHYTDDAVVMICMEPASMGMAAIRKDMSQMVTDPATVLKFQASRVEVSNDGSMGATQGTYTLDVMDPQSKQMMHDHGTYTTIYRKQADGSWKAVFDAAISEVPPPTASSMPAPAADKK